MINVLVTGASGQLGTAIFDVVTNIANDEKYNIDNIYFTDITGWFEKLDCTNYDDVLNFLKEKNITHLINCAAYTNVPKAESDEKLCKHLNIHIPRTLSFACNAVNATLIHISSDYVYSGVDKNSAPFKESDVDFSMRHRVKGVYGRSKLGGEQAVWNNCKKFFIFRTSWLYYDNFNQAFPAKIIAKLTKNDGILPVVSNQIGSPTYAGDLAEAIIQIISDNRTEYGIYNYANRGICSWYDFAVEIEHIWSTSKSLVVLDSRIKPVTLEDNIRPYCSAMDKTKFIDTFGIQIPSWKKSLYTKYKNNTYGI